MHKSLITVLTYHDYSLMWFAVSTKLRPERNEQRCHPLALWSKFTQMCSKSKQWYWSCVHALYQLTICCDFK